MCLHSLTITNASKSCETNNVNTFLSPPICVKGPACRAARSGVKGGRRTASPSRDLLAARRRTHRRKEGGGKKKNRISEPLWTMFLLQYTGLNALSFDPAANNDPLHFNSSSGSPPVENASENSKKRKRASLPPEGIHNMTMESNSISMPMSDPNAWATAMNNLGMPPMGITGQPLMPDFDPNLGMMAGITPINPLMPGLGMVPAPLSHDVPVVKEIIHCKTCTLFPPNPSYRIRLGSSTDKKDTGRLHVDFAQARDDLYEWECRQRMMAREERHRRKIEEDRLRPPSPPPIVHFSEHECSQLGDKIKDDSKFAEAVRVLLTWLERGEVNRRNANNFYSMIQSSNSHIRRLMTEKSQHEKEMEEAKDKFKTALSGILAQFEQIVSVFQAASKQKAWDHFSKAQRKNLDVWRKQAEEIRNIHNEQLMGIRREEEMEMSDDDMEEAPDSKDSEDSGVLQAEALKEENDSLRCQLDAYRNEVELLKQEQGKNQPIRSEEDSTHTQQLSFLQQALQGMQKQLLKMRDDLKQRECELEKSQEDKQQLKHQVHTLKEGLQNLQKIQMERSKQDDRGGEEADNQTNEGTLVSCSQEREGPTERRSPSPVHSEREALLVAAVSKGGPHTGRGGIISTFLHVHPFGASIEYICSYLQRLDTKINPPEVESLLSRLPCTFRQELTGVGASLEKRWNFCGFQGIKST
ncbi:ecto-NOX disulfide-thiol exchanger 2 isoform X8 [Phyllopteryx taeniolatus]|uniref:ecto-NOX disulfide-thiol exchanger 2 isoform X8 n=1 Tax=Phyllopteryx taeniolatus TaxID=161469 RepID=UPI002AD29B4F|nr:ecto-NOX disulfide-thiol exchanger 2 isoform X8 [Phyllopteryx taeniolatus]